MLRETFVALDLETTGTNDKEDRILEIGAVRFRGTRIEARFEQLVNPGRAIPSFITKLTGITQAMVARAPAIEEVLPELVDFVGDAPIVGHNIAFDLGFLRRFELFRHNPVIDTYEVASVLLPTASRYNLGALARELGVPLRNAHRALDDAEATGGILLRLYERALELPVELLAEIVRLSLMLDWPATLFFQYALEEAQQAGPRRPSRAPKSPSRPEPPSAPLSPTPTKADTPRHNLDPEEVAAWLEPGGAFARTFPHYEHRAQQVEMARAVARALSQSHHLMVEAGTGTGKSIAYLLPAALYALRNRTRVVISTNTKNLQDQLIEKDIPLVQKALGQPLRAAVLKGRGNYLCPRRLDYLRRERPRNHDEMRVLGKILVWLYQGGSGVRDELNLRSAQEEEVWRSLSAEDDGCTARVCERRMAGRCPFHQARRAAQQAHLVIVNHALLLTDVLTGQRVLPEYQHLIIDEAHHLESAATNALTARVTEGEVRRLLNELGGPRSGLLGRLRALARASLTPEDYAALENEIAHLSDFAFQFQELLKGCFRALALFLEEQREGRSLGRYAQQERITNAVRAQPLWSEVELAWGEAAQALQHLMEHLQTVYIFVQEWSQAADDEELEDLAGRLSTLNRNLVQIGETLEGLIANPNPELVYWVELHPNGRALSLNAAPLHIGPLMQKHLWYTKDSIILTSATLSTGGDFDYLRERLYAEEVEELALGSPFDYENAALLYLVNDIPEPANHAAYQRAVEQGLISLARATGGRLMALFTSYAQLERTARAIAAPLAEEEIVVFAQGTGASPQTLLESFRESDRAVLLGTRAFWEGVDIPGEDLSVLVIVKLPFAVPSDPLVAARAETFEDPFHQYQVPEAILTFRQGFGRLIRTRSDRGVVAIFDRRVLTKRYGRYFLEALPRCTVRIGSMRELPTAAARWLGLE